MAIQDRSKQARNKLERGEHADWRVRLHEIIFEADTTAGKVFDLLLLVFIAASIVVVMLDSVKSLNLKYKELFYILEWAFTIAFTIEYFLRIIAVKRPSRYIFSFYGIIDLLAILPTFISVFIVGSQYLVVIRVLRLLRIFRVLKFSRYLLASAVLVQSLKASRHKIGIFLSTVLVLVVVLGSIMYMIEGGQSSGFTSIPASIYWAIVTLTTVGYGDIAPVTVLGQSIASVIMILGYSIIAVPTGIITMELAKSDRKATNTQCCRNCNKEGHEDDAVFCKYCGNKL